MTGVVSLVSKGGFAPNPDALADSLEALAQAVRDGREDIATAIVVSRTSKGDVETYSFGQTASVMEGLGMLEYAKMLLMQDD